MDFTRKWLFLLFLVAMYAVPASAAVAMMHFTTLSPLVFIPLIVVAWTTFLHWGDNETR